LFPLEPLGVWQKRSSSVPRTRFITGYARRVPGIGSRAEADRRLRLVPRFAELLRGSASLRKVHDDYIVRSISGNIGSIEPDAVRNERRREELKSHNCGWQRRKKPLTVRLPHVIEVGACLDNHLRATITQFCEVVRAERRVMDFGTDPVTVLLTPVQSSNVPEVQLLSEAGRAIATVRALPASGEFERLLLAATELGGTGVGAAQDTVQWLTTVCAVRLINEGVAFDDLPPPGLPSELLDVAQEAARCAAYELAMERVKLGEARVNWYDLSHWCNLYLAEFFSRFWEVSALAAYGQH